MTTRRPMPAWPWAAAFFVTLLAANGAWWFATRPAAPHPLLRLNVEISPELAIERGNSVTLSVDGTRLGVRLRDHAGIGRLYTRLLAEDRLTALAGTENAAAPFFSPDGRSIGFAAGGKLNKIAVEGGTPVVLCDAPAAMHGASWGDDDHIVFVGTSNNLMRVSASGGEAKEFHKPMNHQAQPEWPQVLPRSKMILFHADGNIEGYSPESGKSGIVERGASSGRFMAGANGGRLLFLRGSTLFAAPFDWEHVSLAEHGVAVAEGIGEFSVSRTGTLVYLPTTAVDEHHVMFLVNFAP